jgi:hypothetical protein
LDGSVWISRVDPAGKGTSDVAQYIASSEKFVSFGSTATSISAFDLIYAASVDTLKTSSNAFEIQVCDCLGLNSLVLSSLSSLIASKISGFMPSF